MTLESRMTLHQSIIHLCGYTMITGVLMKGLEVTSELYLAPLAGMCIILLVQVSEEMGEQ